jgi:hypothetical protein
VIFHLNIIYIFAFVTVRSSALWMVWNKVLYISWKSLSPQSDNMRVVIEIALVTYNTLSSHFCSCADTQRCDCVRCSCQYSAPANEELTDICPKYILRFFCFVFLLNVIKVHILLPGLECTNKQKMFRSKLIFNQNCLNTFMLHYLKLSKIYLFFKKNNTMSMETDV